jgi:hypothetical protein
VISISYRELERLNKCVPAENRLLAQRLQAAEANWAANLPVGHNVQLVGPVAVAAAEAAYL